MKVTPLLLIGSLVANVVLLALLFAEKKSPTSITAPLATSLRVTTTDASAKPATAMPVLASMPPLGPKDLCAADFAAIAARLRAEGFSSEMVRQIIGHLVSRHFGIF